MMNADDVLDFLFGEPKRAIICGVGAVSTIMGGIGYAYHVNKHVYMMRDAAAEQTLAGVKGAYGSDWRQSESEFDIPELDEPSENETYRRQFFDASRAITASSAMQRPNVASALASARSDADSRGSLTGDEEFIHHRAVTACHPNDWNCVPFYREGVEVKVEYTYTTTRMVCTSHNSKGGCTSHGLRTERHWRWSSANAMEYDIQGEGAIARLPQARVLYNIMADARNFALTRSEGAELARERDAFKQTVLPSRTLQAQ